MKHKEQSVLAARLNEAHHGSKNSDIAVEAIDLQEGNFFDGDDRLEC
jgi:hypothetical protein